MDCTKIRPIQALHQHWRRAVDWRIDCRTGWNCQLQRQRAGKRGANKRGNNCPNIPRETDSDGPMAECQRASHLQHFALCVSKRQRIHLSPSVVHHEPRLHIRHSTGMAKKWHIGLGRLALGCYVDCWNAWLWRLVAIQHSNRHSRNHISVNEQVFGTVWHQVLACFLFENQKSISKNGIRSQFNCCLRFQ